MRRLEVRAHGLDLGNRREDCVLDILGDLVCVLQGQIAGKLQVERHLHAAVDLEHDQVVDLADLRHRERGGQDSLARLSFGAPRLDVDDDVGIGKPRAQRFLDAVSGRVPLTDGCTGRNADHHVGEVHASCLTHAQPSQLDRRIQLGDRPPCALLGVSRRPVHEDVDVSTQKPARRDDHESRDEERRDRVSVRYAESGKGQARENRERADEIAAEVKRVRNECVAALLPAGPPGDGES